MSSTTAVSTSSLKSPSCTATAEPIGSLENDTIPIVEIEAPEELQHEPISNAQPLYIASPTSSLESSSSTAAAEPVVPSENATIPSEEVETQAELQHESIPSTRLSYTREEKLLILKFYYENGCNKYRTCQKFGIAKGSLFRWIETEDELKKAKKGSKRIGGGGRRAFWPDVEEKLAEEFKESRQKGVLLRHDWFRTRAHQLMNELHPDVIFRFSPGWFDRFKARNDIKRPRAKNVASFQGSEATTNPAL